LVSTLDLMPTILEACGAKVPVTSPGELPGSSLQPLFKVGKPAWRSHYFAEYHSHAAAPNYFPQRCVRNSRYKLVESLLPNTVHPDYDKTISKLHGDYVGQKYPGQLDLKKVIARTKPVVRSAYELMQMPPRYQLYDLESDPYEFVNLAEKPGYEDVLADLKRRLTDWRRETGDPLLDPEKLQKLTEEVQSVSNRKIARERKWKYPSYLAD